MGFTPKSTIYRLKFEGDLDGLEVVTRSASVVAYEDMAELADWQFASPPNAADRKRIAETYEAFAAVLVEWNLEVPAGVPVPTTLAGIKTQEPGLVHAIITAWMEAVAEALASKPADELVAELEASLPMEPLPA